jgi:alpha-tubulin suppressor-like RCC1 family protein
VGDDETPASAGQLVEVGGAVVQLSAAASHACAVLDTGSVRCWGIGHDGNLGYGNEEDIGDDETPASAGDVDLGGAAIEVAAGGNGGSDHTCALLVGGRVRCWGYGHTGNLGYANTDDIGDDESPASAGDVDLGGLATQIVAGDGFSCALLDTGNVRCWGFAVRGRLGYGNTEMIGDDETPAAAGDVDVGEAVVRLAAGGRHTCALLQGGRVRCWGYGADGSLGYANAEDVGNNETPASAGDVPLDGSAVQVSAGTAHTCAVLDTGELRCWGNNFHGELGLPGLVTGCFSCTGKAGCCIGDDEPPSATSAIDVGGGVAHVAAGRFHVCALLDTGGVRCWGTGQDGALGHGDTLTIGDDEPPSAAGDVAVF